MDDIFDKVNDELPLGTPDDLEDGLLDRVRV
jgi:hypothetical protein